MFKIHLWVHKAPHNSFKLHFLWNGSSKWEKTAVGSEYFDGKQEKNASFLSNSQNSLLVSYDTTSPLGVKSSITQNTFNTKCIWPLSHGVGDARVHAYIEGTPT